MVLSSVWQVDMDFSQGFLQVSKPLGFNTQWNEYFQIGFLWGIHIIYIITKLILL